MREKRNSVSGVNALNVDQYTFEELDRLVQEFQLIDGGPGDIGPVEDDNWEDLEYAEETMRFGRSQPLQVSNSITEQMLHKVTRQPPKRMHEYNG